MSGYRSNSLDTASRLLQLNMGQLNKSWEKLASGKRINHASDDAAGLAILEMLNGQIRGAGVAMNNIQDGNGALNIADGALSGVSNDLQRIRELTVQASNGTLSQAQRDAIGQEISGLSQNIDRVAQSTNFNGQPLLDGSLSMNLQVGPNSGDTINVTTGNAQTDLAAGGIALFDSGGSTTFTDAANLQGNFTQANAQNFLADIDNALANVNDLRSSIGASQNQLDSAYSGMTVYRENTTASASRIGDLDIAAEMAQQIRLQILVDANARVFQQAKKHTAQVIKLLK